MPAASRAMRAMGKAWSAVRRAAWSATSGLAVFGLCVLAPTPARAQSVAWTQRMVSGPSARFIHAMAYDAARGVTVLFGGHTHDMSFFDTREWNGSTWTPRMVSPPLAPSRRLGHAMVYDAARGVTVLFGGYDTSTFYNGETWEWSGIAWTQRTLSGPSARSGHAMAYDAARGVTVLFGGGGGGGSINGETWEWNGTAWAQRMVSGPSPRAGHAMAYDALRGVTVLFGGATSATSINGETWEWNGAAWTQRMVSGPSARQSHAIAYDPARAVTVLFGGSKAPDANGETWEWNGTAWTQRMVSGPSPRYAHAMAHDAARGVTIRFGGITGVDPVSNANGETWELGVTCGPADYDHNGRLEPADVSLFVSTSFNSLVTGTLAGDFDGNGFVQPADVSLFITIWFNALTTGC